MSFYKEVPGRQTTLESTLKFDTEPKAGSTNYVTSDGVKGAIGKSAENSLDDHDPDDLTIVNGSKEFYDKHELGYYHALGDKIYLCTEHTRSGEEGAYTGLAVLGGARMEPKIYKPSIYKGAGIYKAGAEGGPVINENYETDFSEFDVDNKYDIPKEGYLTSYSRVATYQKENGKLKIIAPSGNVDFKFFNPLFLVKKNSVLNLYDVELESTSDYNFLWLDLYSSSALACHNSLSANELLFLIDASLTYTTTMNLLHSGSDFKWFGTSFSLLQSNNIRVEYDEYETRYYVNDTLIITTNYSVYNKVNGISIEPRVNKCIKISGIKFKQ